MLGYSGAAAERDTPHHFSDMATSSPLLGPASSQTLPPGFGLASVGPSAMFSGLSPLMQHRSAGPLVASAGSLQLPRAAVSSPVPGAATGQGGLCGNAVAGYGSAGSAAQTSPVQYHAGMSPSPGAAHHPPAAWPTASAEASAASALPGGHKGATAEAWGYAPPSDVLGGKAVMLARRGVPVPGMSAPAPAVYAPATQPLQTLHAGRRQQSSAARPRLGGKSVPAPSSAPRGPATASARSAGARPRADSPSEGASATSPSAVQSPSDAPGVPSRGSRSARRGAAGRRGGESPKKRRFLWDHELHRAFIAAVFDIGVRQATPKSLFEAMRSIIVQGMPAELDDGQLIPGGSAGLAGYGGRDGPLHSTGMVKAVHGGAKRQAATGAAGGDTGTGAVAGGGPSPSEGVPSSVESMAVLRHDGCPDNMTSEHIKSHLQKFRANVRKSRDAFLQDYSRAMREARARASEEEAKTGAVANPPGFSTFPMSMPVHMQPEHPPMHRPDGSLLYPPAMDAQAAARLVKASKRRGGAARAKAEAALAAAAATEAAPAVRRSKRSRSDASLKAQVAGSPSKPSLWPGGVLSAAEVEVDVPLCSASDEAPGLLAFPAASLDELAGSATGSTVFRSACRPDPVDASAVSLDAGALAMRLLDALDSQGVEMPSSLRAMLPAAQETERGAAKRPRLAAHTEDPAVAPAAAASGPLAEAAAAALRALLLLSQAQSPRVESAPVAAVARMSLGQLAPALVTAGLDTTSLMWPLLGPGAVGPLGPQHWKDPLWAAVSPEAEEAEAEAQAAAGPAGAPAASLPPPTVRLQVSSAAGKSTLAATGESNGAGRSPWAPAQPAVPQPCAAGAVSLPTVPASLEGLIKTMQKRQTVHRTMQLQQADHARKYSAHPNAAGAHPPTALDTVQALAGPISHLNHLRRQHEARLQRAAPAGNLSDQTRPVQAKGLAGSQTPRGPMAELSSPFQVAGTQPMHAPSPVQDRPGSHLADYGGAVSSARRRRASSLGLGLSMSPGADSDGAPAGGGGAPSPALFSFLADGFQ